jgi:hypothetical protein
MIKLIIDQNYNKYQPQFVLSGIDFFEYNIEKYSKAYIFIDNVALFKKLVNIPKNVVFLIDKDIVINREDLLIEKVKYTLNKEADFKEKVIKHKYIFNWLFKKEE